MDKDRVLSVLADAGVFLKDSHFVYASGQHGSEYVDKDALYRNPLATDRVARAIADQWSGWGIDAVVGPEKGGIVLANYVALHLSNPMNVVQAYYAERIDLPTGQEGQDHLIRRSPGFVIKRGARWIPGRRVLVVEDVFNSGESAKETVSAVRTAGGLVIGVGGIWNRGGVTAETLNVNVLSPLLATPLDQWPESDCPLCKEAIPVQLHPGHGDRFLFHKAAKAARA